MRGIICSVKHNCRIHPCISDNTHVLLEAVHSTFAQLSVASRNFRQPDFVQLLHLLQLRRLAAREGTVPLRSLADLDQLCVMHRAFVLAMRSAAVFACWMPACFAMFDYIPGTLSVKLVFVFPDMASHTLFAVIAVPLAVLQLPF